VLLKPPVQRNTLLLWGLPGVLIGIMALWFILSRRRTSAPTVETPVLSDEDKALLERILDDQA